MHSARKYLVVIAGPTAVGKTALAITLARRFQTVIISADSRQFYREMNIGTAKPTAEELVQVPHYFINNKSITELYGSGHYAKDVHDLMEELFKKHQVLILAGGSGLYIDAVLHGVDKFDEVPPEVRQLLNTTFKTQGIEWLRETLKSKDPAYYSVTDTNNPQRMIRALEVCIHSGQPYSNYLKRTAETPLFTPVKLLINISREKLYQRINARVDRMIAQGLVEEVMSLADHKDLNALKTVGYKEIFSYLEGECDLPSAIAKIKQHTRNYAKRQITWFKNRDRFVEFAPDDHETIVRYITERMRGG